MKRKTAARRPATTAKGTKKATPEKRPAQPMDAAAIKAYLAALPADQRAALAQLRRTIRAAAPDAVEYFAYGLPGFKYRRRPLAYYGAAKNHCALYGLSPDAAGAQLKGYDVSKGTIRFTPGHPLPVAAVTKLIRTRLADIDKAEAARKTAKTTRKTAAKSSKAVKKATR